MNTIDQYKRVMSERNTKSIEQRIIEAFNKCKESSI
jgi:hypothetical protein